MRKNRKKELDPPYKRNNSTKVDPVRSSDDGHEVVSIFKQISEENVMKDTINENITRMSIDSRGVLPFGIIVVPTRELATQIYHETKKLIAGSNIRAVCVYGGSETVKRQLMEMSKGGCDILIGTPGRLEDFIDRGIVCLDEVRFIIIDEVDRMFDSMGFEKHIRKLMNSLVKKELRQCLCFSATFSDSVKEMASEFLDNYISLSVGTQGKTLVSTVRQKLVLATPALDHKLTLLIEHIRGTSGRTLVFVRQKKICSWVTLLLKQYGIAANEIHGDRIQSEREESLENFRTGHILVLVATDVASRGIDVCDVTHVINFDLPISVDEFSSYIHRIGRTGRGGQNGLSTSFYVPGLAKDSNNMLVGSAKISILLKQVFVENGDQLPDWFLNSDDFEIATRENHDKHQSNNNPQAKQQSVNRGRQKHTPSVRQQNGNSSYPRQNSYSNPNYHYQTIDGYPYYQNSMAAGGYANQNLYPMCNQMYTPYAMHQQMFQQQMFQQQMMQQQMMHYQMMQPYSNNQMQLTGQPFVAAPGSPNQIIIDATTPVMPANFVSAPGTNIYTLPMLEQNQMLQGQMMQGQMMMGIVNPMMPQYCYIQPLSYNNGQLPIVSTATTPASVSPDDKSGSSSSGDVENNTESKIVKSLKYRKDTYSDLTDTAGGNSNSLKTESSESIESIESIVITTTTTKTTKTKVNAVQEIDENGNDIKNDNE